MPARPSQTAQPGGEAGVRHPGVDSYFAGLRRGAPGSIAAALQRQAAKRAALPKSDERSKQAIETVRGAPAYEYEYKPEEMGPGAPPGRHIGPMAQDLEKTPMGRTAVAEDARGMKRVDTSRLPLILTGAVHDIDQRLRRLEGKK